jgi:hypothetical protein
MRRWFVGLALVLGFTAVGQAQQVAPAQAPAPDAPVQIQAAPAQVQIQIAPAQVIQAEPNIARADVAIMPGFGGGVGRFTQSDVIVVGRVVAFEPMDVEAPQGPNQPKTNYRVAIVQVTEAIHGLKKDTQTVRVAFPAQANNGGGAPGAIGGGIQILPALPPGNFQPQPGLIGGRRPYIGGVMNLQMGQDGIFMLNKHHKENFYLVPNYTSFVNRQNNPNFDNEVKTAKQLGKVMGDPVAFLKSEDAQERVTAAAVLINKYRNPNNQTGAPMKQEPIDAEESKLILKALGQGDWNINRASPNTPSAFEMFNQLGLSQKDGYNPVNVRNQQDIVKAMQTWLTANTDKYRIQKFVVDPNAKNVNPVPQPGGVIRPGVRPLPIQIQPIKGKVQILPAPVPAPAPVQLKGGKLQILPAPVPAPVQRDLPQVEPAAPQDLPAQPLPLRRE